MICAVSNGLQRQQFLRAAQGCPGPGTRMAVQLNLFGDKPESGWQFYTGGRGECSALMVRGGSAVCCGRWDAEELGALLCFLRVQQLISDSLCAPTGFCEAEAYTLFTNGTIKPQGVLPLTLNKTPSPGKIARLVWEEEPNDSGEVRDNFYSDLCTALNHGMAMVWALEQDGCPVSTVGAYGLWQGQAYLAGAETCPNRRKEGLGGALLCRLAAELQQQGFICWFWCKPHLIEHYKRLGFIQKGKIYNFIRIEE